MCKKPCSSSCVYGHICMCILRFSQNGHNMFSWFFNVESLNHLLHTEVTLLFIHHIFVIFYLQLQTYIVPHMSKLASTLSTSTNYTRLNTSEINVIYIQLAKISKSTTTAQNTTLKTTLQSQKPYFRIQQISILTYKLLHSRYTCSDQVCPLFHLFISQFLEIKK